MFKSGKKKAQSGLISWLTMLVTWWGKQLYVCLNKAGPSPGKLGHSTFEAVCISCENEREQLGLLREPAHTQGFTLTLTTTTPPCRVLGTLPQTF